MIPRLHKRGQSFKETLNYVLHDVQAQTSERVGWTLTENLFAPVDLAWREMLDTCNRQQTLKAAAGVDARGRKNTNPVLHYSLSWAPGETPTKEEMQAAARGSLEALGLASHEAVIAGHEDKAHPHVHIVVNTIHQVTGRTAPLKFTKLELSRWAERYEREHGIHCDNRLLNNADRQTVREARASETLVTLDAAAKGAAIDDRSAYVRIKDQSPSRREWTLMTERAAMAAAVLQALTRHASTFTEHDLAKHVNKRTKTGVEFLALMSAVKAHPDLVLLDKAEKRFTTKEMVRIEREMADTAKAMTSRTSHCVEESVSVPGLILSADQDHALSHVLEAHGFSSVVGVAGSGKSTMLAAARASWEKAGLKVRGAALSGIAAKGLAEGSGITSSTLHRLLWQLKEGKSQLSARDVVVVDEAGMVGSRQMHTLLVAARAAGAKVVLVGDPDQLRAIDAGAAFRALIERTGAARMSDVRRQRIAWQREATLDLASGQTARAVAAYQDAGRIQGHGDAEAMLDTIAKRWLNDRAQLNKGQVSLVVASTNDLVDAINERVRNALKQSGTLGWDTTLRAVDEGVDRPRTEFDLSVAVGDRLMFRKNDTKLGVQNGTVGTVRRFRDNKIAIAIEGVEPRILEVDLTTYRNFAHAYAMTIHKAQGVTAERVHVVAGRNMDSNLTYVALSRHKGDVTLHWSKDHFASSRRLVSALSRERPKDTTLDYADPKPSLFEPPSRAPGGLRKSTSRAFARSTSPSQLLSALRAETRAWGRRKSQGFGLEL